MTSPLTLYLRGRTARNPNHCYAAMTPARGSPEAGTNTLRLWRVALIVSVMFAANAIDIGELPADPPAERGETFLIDLPTALRLAERENPTIAIAREAIAENLALQRQAR